MNKNQRIVLIIGDIILLTYIVICPPACLNPTAYGGYLQSIALDMPANGLRMCIAAVTLLVCFILRDKRTIYNPKGGGDRPRV